MAYKFHCVLGIAKKDGKQVVQRYCGFNQKMLRAQPNLTHVGSTEIPIKKWLGLKLGNPFLYQ